jgi:adenosylmethionine-8-amino-7-oxononanoate aminotransferase
MPVRKKNSMPKWFDEGFEHLWYPYTQMQAMPTPQAVVGASGAKLHLADGRSLIDGISAWWCMCHGYQHPYMVEKMQAQVAMLSNVMFAGTAHEQAYTLATRLAKLSGMERVFFTDSGSTAVETAMKMAVQYWKNKGAKGRDKFLSFAHGYHGDTMGCMSLCDPSKGMHRFFNHYMPKQYSVEIPSDEYDFAEFEALLVDIKNATAAIVIEPLVQGAGGMRFHSADTLAEIHRLAKKHDILLIADEIMTGFGRTGAMFACDEAGITPDIMCVGKGLTGGMMTMAATLASEEVFSAFLHDEMEYAFMSGPTFMASPLGCAAANASLDLFENEPRLAQVEAIETQLYQGLMPLKGRKNVVDVRIKGAIGVVELDTDWPHMFALREKFIEHGVWLRPFAGVIYIMPPFTISKDELAQLINAVDAVL